MIRLKVEDNIASCKILTHVAGFFCYCFLLAHVTLPFNKLNNWMHTLFNGSGFSVVPPCAAPLKQLVLYSGRSLEGCSVYYTSLDSGQIYHFHAVIEITDHAIVLCISFQSSPPCSALCVWEK